MYVQSMICDPSLIRVCKLRSIDDIEQKYSNEIEIETETQAAK